MSRERARARIIVRFLCGSFLGFLLGDIVVVPLARFSGWVTFGDFEFPQVMLLDLIAAVIGGLVWVRVRGRQDKNRER